MTDDRQETGQHAPEDLVPARLLRELSLCERAYGTDRIAGVPIARIPTGLRDRVQIALNSHATLTAQVEAMREQKAWILCSERLPQNSMDATYFVAIEQSEREQ